MKRREAISLIPLSIASLSGMVPTVFALGRKPVSNVESKKQQAIAGNKKMGPYRITPGLKPMPIRYTEKVREMLSWIRRTQSENILEASHAVARTVKNGCKCWCAWDMGHSTKFDMFPDRNGNPGIFTMGFNENTAKKNDLFLASMHSKPEVLTEKEIFVIGQPCPWGMDAKMPELIVRDSAKLRLRPYANIWIDNQMTTIGAIMDVPGSPAPIGPVSGIIGMVTFWMITADACRILAQNSIKMKVQGDEPLLGEKSPWIGLADPIMDDYFEKVTRQIDMIGAELGNIRKIAEMAVDAALNGGRVFCYSKRMDGLSVEAQNRRGGLAMTKGIHESNGKLTAFGGAYGALKDSVLTLTDKDFVIMGIWKPDDETDLKYLDLFRQTGMRVASIGPMTRDIQVPAGRTVPKESDVHVGRMCDTYGLYAIPGFDKKVCPTSGALINQIFWASCMAIVEEIISRTGNSPGIVMSAAIKDGTELGSRVHNLYWERGY